jgi:gliding motility-associated-like protein
MKKCAIAFWGIILLLIPILAYAQPVANFNSNITIACSPIVAQFTDQSTGSPTSWQWNLGNGVTSNLQNPSTTYIIPGTYTVTLIATNAGGSDTLILTNYITVKASPDVYFTGDSSVACPPTSVPFTNMTIPNAGGTTTYLWDFGDGGSSSSANPTHIYTTAGNFSVTLIATNSLGCSRNFTKTAYIPVLANPAPSFSSANNNSCVIPHTVNFTNSSTNAVSYQWDFGDGGNSTAVTPSHQYNSAGSYIVRLIATNSIGCMDTFIQTAFVNLGSLSASFTANIGGCVNEPISFTNTTTPLGGTSYTWYFGDDSVSTAVSPAHIYKTTGTFNVMLVAQLGNCKDTAYQTVTITNKPVSQFTANSTVSCSAPFSVQFTNTSTGGAATYFWIFGDGTTSTQTNPSKTYTTTGIFTVKLVAYNSVGCADTITKANYIYTQQPDSNQFSLNPLSYSSHCPPAIVEFVAGNSISATPTNYAWNFGNSQTSSCPTCGPVQQTTYASPGVYNVTVTSSFGSGCTVTKTTTVYIGTSPAASFTVIPDTVCPNQAVNFTNSSTGALTYYWLFGDGDTSTQVSPSHMYGASGSYTVMLIARNNSCADTLTIPNMVFVKLPTAKFESNYDCSNRKMFNFYDMSVGADTYYWNFGDGNTSTSSGPIVSHTYASFGTYTVTQVVTNNATGCTDSFIQIITSFPLTSTFGTSNNNVCKGATVAFYPPYPTGATYKWDFGDGGTSTAKSPTHQYAAIGTYNVKLVTTETASGCKDSVTQIGLIHVTGPIVDFSGTPIAGCLPLNVNFTDLSVGNGASITTRKWVFGDGQQNTLAGPNTSNIYNAVGSYDVQLKVTDANGCIDSLTKNNYINPTKPTVAFFTNDTSTCVGSINTFTNLSGGTGLSVLWDFGDGNTSTTYTPTHAYAAAGFYTVKLVVTDINGCKDSIIKSNYIEVISMAVSFAASDTVAPCPPLAVNFTNNTTGATTYTWNLGNGSFSNLTNPSVVYTYPGVYAVKLISQNAVGCKDSATRNITVYGPTGTFSYSPIAGCNPLTVNFSSVSNNTQSYIWDMNNGVTQNAIAASFSYTYTQAGKYLPKLILSDGMSCLVPVQGIDTIKVDDVSADFSFSPLSLCDTGTIQFTDTVYVSQTAVTRSWLFGDGGNSTVHNPSHFYATPGTYQVKLIVTNTNGCADTVFKTVNVYTSPNVSAGNNQTICAGISTPLQLLATGATAYTWTPSTGLSCTNCANPTVTPSGTITYVVSGTDIHGCTDTGNITIAVNPLPNVSASPDVSICTGASTGLLATGGVSYVWSPSTGLSCTNCANPTANPTTTTSYIVTGTAANGCTDTGNVTVTVNTSPTISGGPNKVICSGLSTTLQGTGGVSYTWSPATGLSCTSCASPTANPTTTTVYTVTGFAVGGCSNTANVTVTVNPLPTISGGPNKIICSGLSTTLQGTGGVSYTWSPSTGLSCTNCANPTANPTTTTVYTVTGTDANGCINTANVTVTVNPLPTISGGANKIICSGLSTTLQGTGGVSYTWSPSTGLSCTNCANPTANPTTTTVYTVTGTDANGCINTANVTVTVNPLPTISGGANKIICSGLSTTLQGTGGVSNTWSPSTGLSCTNCANPTANPTTTTVYTVTGTDGNGCINTANVTVNVNPLPNVSGGGNKSICVGSSTTLPASGATSYTWSPSTGLSCTNCAMPTANPTTTTVYTLTGTDGNGCINTANVTVTVNPLPTISGGPNKSICTGSSTTLPATGGVSYTWSPATGLSCTNCATPTANPTTTTVYTVTGTNGNGCVNTATVTVTVNPLPTISGGSNKTICAGSSATLQATGGTFYAWTPTTGLSCSNCSGPSASPAATTVYTVTGTDGNGCSNTAQVTVNVNPLPTIGGGGNQSICLGSSVQLQGTGAVSYTWSPATGLSCTNCANPVANPTVNTTYTVTGTDGNGCVNTATVTVTVNAIPNVTATTNKTVLCDGTSAQLQANGAANYSWSPAVGLSCINCANPQATPPNAITYIVTGTTNGCSDTAQITINVLPKPNVNAGSDTFICIGGSTILNGSGTAPLTWSPAATLSCSNCSSPVATPLGTTIYTLTATDANNCSNKDDVIITVHPPPVINAGNDITICNGNTTQLLASGANSYTWSPATGLSCTNCSNPVASPTAQTIYKVKGVDGFGCSDSDEVQITVIQKGPISAGPDAEICRGSSTQLNVSGGDSYLWIPSSGLSNANIPNPVATPENTITYTVIIKQGICFADTSKVKVTVNEIPVVDAGPDENTISGNTIQLRALGSNVVKYEWTPAASLDCSDCQSPRATPFVTTTYEVIVFTSAGCSAKDNVTINVSCDNSQIFMANTFTPNGDGINDRFFPQGKGLSTIQRLRIFNRWGQIVFDVQNMPLNDESKGWDGTLRSEPLNPDVFVYILNATCESGEPLELKGDISLVR